MNWDQIAGKWLQIKGSVRQRWGKLTDDDLEVIAGSKDKFVGRIQERYGIAKEEAEHEIDDWAMTATASPEGASPQKPRARRKGA
jgi:uncharacterized protein YjbJ (UPF0337 family)